MRYIDAFNHFFPMSFFERIGTQDLGKRMRGIPAIYDIDKRLRIVEFVRRLCAGPLPRHGGGSGGRSRSVARAGAHRQ